MPQDFSADIIRATGRNTQGVKALTLRDEDLVVSAMLIKNPDTDLLTIIEMVMEKEQGLDEYPQYNRGGKGVRNIKCSENRNVVSVLEVFDDEELMCINLREL